MTTPRILPVRPSLESIRKQAKKLARDVAAGNADAVARARAQRPDIELPPSQRDAQLVLAREYGFAGWQDLRAEVLRRMGKGLEWASAQAERAIFDNDVGRLKQLLAEHPALLSWRDDSGNVLLQATTSYAMDCADPVREREYNRPACAELLIDAGAAIQPSVWEQVIYTGAAGMLQLLWRKGVLPRTLPNLAALGDLEAVRARLSGTADDLATVNRAFMYACRSKHESVASILLQRCIALDGDLGRRIDAWPGRAAFVAYQCAHTPYLGGYYRAGRAPVTPWQAFVMHQLKGAMDENDLPAFARWLQGESYLLGDSGLGFQVELLERAAWNDRGPFITQLLDLDPAVLHRRPPPPSSSVAYAVAYGNAHLVPLLARIWPLPDDLPHAAGVGDLARVKRWFDDAGRPALGNLHDHFPASHKQAHENPGWGANDLQRILDTALAWACMNRQLGIAAFLLEHGADINSRWSTHEPASILHECVLHNNFEAVRFLIDHGVDLTIRCHRYNGTAEGWAYNATKNMEMVELLAAAERQRNKEAAGRGV